MNTPCNLRGWALLCVLGSLTLFTERTHAQFIDIKPTTASYEYYSSAAVRADTGARTADVRIQQFRVGLTVPVLLNHEHTILLPGLRYQQLDIMASSISPATGPVPDALHSMLLTAGIWQRFDDHWSVYANVTGGLSADLSGSLSSGDWLVTGQLIGMWTIIPQFTLGAGVGYDRRTGELAPLPLIGLDWQPNDYLLLRGVLPTSLSVRYRPLRPITLAMEGAFEGDRFHLNPQKYQAERAELAYSNIKLSLAVTAHWTSFVHTRFHGGLLLRRRFETFVDRASRADLSAGVGSMAGVEIWLGPSGWKSDSPTPDTHVEIANRH